MRVLTRLASTVAILALVGVLAPVAIARIALKRVQYLGATVSVPASWPVLDLGRLPRTCVRFDRHAVYLGRPGVSQACPAHLVGRSEALLLEPLQAASAAAGVSRADGNPTGGQTISVRLPGAPVIATASWNRDPQLVERLLAGRRQLAAAPRLPAIGTTAGARAARASARASSGYTTGLGFDPCATPSAATMKAWRASPYHSVGVYLGGINAACSQPNLTAGWVRTETAAGWHLIPTYVGLQAPRTSCGCATIAPGRASAQGTAAAADAVARAHSVGIGPGNPIIFDMEAYQVGGSATRTALAFLSAWTRGLHASGYLSGVYSSAASGIVDLVNAHGTSFVEPDEVWFAHWNGQHTASDTYLPANLWAAHQRIHQYSGGVDVTYRGYTLNIDGDYLDGPAAPVVRAPQFADGTFVQVSGTSGVYTIAGGAPLPVSNWAAFGGRHPVSTIKRAQFAQLSHLPVDGTFLVTDTLRLYRVAGGAALPVSSWSLFGGSRKAVTVDPSAIAHAGLAGSHLNAVPAPGTLVKGLPSGTLWRFVTGGRTAVGRSGSPGTGSVGYGTGSVGYGTGSSGSGVGSSGSGTDGRSGSGAGATSTGATGSGSGGVSSGSGGAGSGSAVIGPSAATAVDDIALQSYPIVKVVPGCTVPRLRHLTVSAATRALISARCRLGRILRPAGVPHGHVLLVTGQSEPSGHRHSAGYRVTLTLR